MPYTALTTSAHTWSLNPEVTERSPGLAGRAVPGRGCSPSGTGGGRGAESQAQGPGYVAASLTFLVPALLSPPTVPGEKTVSDGTLLCWFMQEDIWALTV